MEEKPTFEEVAMDASPQGCVNGSTLLTAQSAVIRRSTSRPARNLVAPGHSRLSPIVRKGMARCTRQI
jgi:hypothetical protein